MNKTRILKFKDSYNQDVFLAQKKGWFGWKPLNWPASWHHSIEHAKQEIDSFILNEYVNRLSDLEAIYYP